MMGNGEARRFLIEDEALGIAGSCDSTTFTFFTPMSNSVHILPSFSCFFFLSTYILFAFTFARMLTEAGRLHHTQGSVQLLLHHI